MRNVLGRLSGHRLLPMLIDRVAVD
jgi:hypothetical protein